MHVAESAFQLINGGPCSSDSIVAADWGSRFPGWPAHGTAYRRLLRHRRDSSFLLAFCLPNMLTSVILLRVLGVYKKTKCHANLFVNNNDNNNNEK